MINIFSQIVKKGDIDYVYDCSINNNDMVCFSYTIIHEKNNTEILSSIMIDFPTLRNFFESENKIEYDSEDYTIKIFADGQYEVFSKEDDEYIIIPMTFLEDSYNVLSKMWVDD